MIVAGVKNNITLSKIMPTESIIEGLEFAIFTDNINATTATKNGPVSTAFMFKNPTITPKTTRTHPIVGKPGIPLNMAITRPIKKDHLPTKKILLTLELFATIPPPLIMINFKRI
jgi:hypothetical protein